MKGKRSTGADADRAAVVDELRRKLETLEGYLVSCIELEGGISRLAGNDGFLKATCSSEAIAERARDIREVLERWEEVSRVALLSPMHRRAEDERGQAKLDAWLKATGFDKELEELMGERRGEPARPIRTKKVTKATAKTTKKTRRKG